MSEDPDKRRTKDIPVTVRDLAELRYEVYTQLEKLGDAVQELIDSNKETVARAYLGGKAIEITIRVKALDD